MKFHLTCNDADFLAWLIAWNTRPGKKVQCVLMRIWAWILLVLMASNVLLDILNTNFTLWTVVSAAFLYVAIVFANYPKRIIKMQVSSLKKEGKLPYWEKSTVEFTEDEICETSEYGMERAKYSDLTNILRDKEHIHLQIGAMKGVILPLRCLDGQEQALLDFLQDKLALHKRQ